MLDKFTEYLNSFAQILPLEIFLFVGSIVEEIIAPIPSPFVSTLGGSIALAKGYPLIMLLVLAFIASIGKVIGSVIIYKIADYGEDIILGRFGKVIGLSHSNVEKIGSKFHQGNKDWFILFGLRSLPIVPSSPISAVCGLIKLPLKTFITASIAGNMVRSFIFIYIGYSGAGAYSDFLNGIESLESLIKYVGLIIALILVAYFYYRRRKLHKN